MKIYIKYKGKHSVSVHYVNEGVIVDENMPEDMLEVLFTEWYKMAS